MRSYKVVMVAPCPFPANWGTPGAIREMSEALSELGHEIHIVTYPFGEDLPVGRAKIWRPRYWRKSIHLRSGPSLEKLLLDLLLLVKLLRVIRVQRIEFIHAHNYEGALIGALAKLLTGRRLLYNAVSWMSDELPSYNFIRPAFLARLVARLLDWIVPKFPDRFIAVTKDLRATLIKHGVPAERVMFIPCGVRPEMFDRPEPAPLRLRYGVGARPVIMYTGVTGRLQRIDYLLKAFSLVAKSHPEALLMVVSPLTRDPDLASNRAYAESLGLNGSVIWVQGHTLNELPDYLAMATVTVLPRPEVPGHPVKLLNYMAARKPTVCFEGGAKGVQHLRDAFVVQDHDWRNFSRGIVALLDNPELASRLGVRARETVVANFDSRHLCARVESAYQALNGAQSGEPQARQHPLNIKAYLKNQILEGDRPVLVSAAPSLDSSLVHPLAASGKQQRSIT